VRPSTARETLESAAGHGKRPSNAQIFFGIYFLMTGLHGIHVLAGMGAITWILVRSIKGEFGPEYFTPVDFVGLYWHLVDLIWIFLFPLLYLIS
jgi:cytochrome c oxidase subunit 3